MYLSKLGQRNGEDHDSITYADLAAVVQRKQSMEFLHDIVPQKIKYSEYLKMMEEDKPEDDLFWTKLQIAIYNHLETQYYPHILGI